MALNPEEQRDGWLQTKQMEVEVLNGGRSMSSSCGEMRRGPAESPQTLPIVDPHRCALLPEHRGQKRNREIPQLTNAKIHRHRVTLGIHATPSINTPAGDSSAAQTGSPAV